MYCIAFQYVHVCLFLASFASCSVFKPEWTWFLSSAFPSNGKVTIAVVLVLCISFKWRLPPSSLSPNAERGVRVWEGLHRSYDHARLPGLLHQNPGGGQQQESWCENQLWEIKAGAVSGPGPLQRVDLKTCRPRYWNGNHLYSWTGVTRIIPAFEPAFVAEGSLARDVESIEDRRLCFGFSLYAVKQRKKGKKKKLCWPWSCRRIQLAPLQYVFKREENDAVF